MLNQTKEKKLENETPSGISKAAGGIKTGLKAAWHIKRGKRIIRHLKKGKKAADRFRKGKDLIAHIKKGRKAVRAIRRLKRTTRAINRIGEINEKRERIRAIRREVLAYGDDIIHSDRFEKAKHVSHHIKFTVAIHSVEVAMYALLIIRALKRHHLAPKVDERDLVRAALLHDIGMTNDQVHDSPSYKKAFSHPKEGLRIARDEFHLNKIQLNAIQRHMWPIGIIPPKHLIGWILTMADNMSSFNEGTAMLKEKLRKRKELAKEKLRKRKELAKEKLRKREEHMKEKLK